MATDTNPPHERAPVGRPVETVELGHCAEMIVLRGAIAGGAVEELRARLLAAIGRGVRELFLDLSEVESVDGPVYDLVSAASLALADQGGVLVIWNREDATGGATYVIADVRSRALAELAARFAADGS
jgi:anti-anti-sigma regulatory factor